MKEKGVKFFSWQQLEIPNHCKIILRAVDELHFLGKYEGSILEQPYNYFSQRNILTVLTLLPQFFTTTTVIRVLISMFQRLRTTYNSESIKFQIYAYWIDDDKSYCRALES